MASVTVGDGVGLETLKAENSGVTVYTQVT